MNQSLFVFSGGQKGSGGGWRVFVPLGELNDTLRRKTPQNAPHGKQGEQQVAGKVAFGLQTPCRPDSEQAAHDEAQVA
jgi:hypothetical protein